MIDNSFGATIVVSADHRSWTWNLRSRWSSSGRSSWCSRVLIWRTVGATAAKRKYVLDVLGRLRDLLSALKPNWASRSRRAPGHQTSYSPASASANVDPSTGRILCTKDFARAGCPMYGVTP
jgi:hypothetical protein